MRSFIRCAIATLNEGKLADIQHNVKHIKKLTNKAEQEKAQIIVFPELSITGYTCQDLFCYSKLIDQSRIAIQELKSFSCNNNILIVVGAPIAVNDTIYNCAVAINRGKILGIVPKQYLPNYSEFYEHRWFKAYTEEDFSIKKIEFHAEEVPFGNLIFSSSLGYKFGIEICEDLWSLATPSTYLVANGAHIIANLSASNDIVGKNAYRQTLISAKSSSTISAYLYTSSGFNESTSDLVFGGSGYIYENGKELTSLERFSIKNEIAFADIDIEALSNDRRINCTFTESQNRLRKKVDFTEIEFNQVDFFQNMKNDIHLFRTINPHPFVPSGQNNERGKVCKEILNIQSTGLAKRLSCINCNIAVIGISGGLDSTLALIVTHKAFQKLGLDVKGIMGVTMPGFGTTNRTLENSIKLCEEFGISTSKIDIKAACMQHFKDIGHDPQETNITYENVQARERTQILMDLANKHNGIVIGTGDLSELEIGWCTYNGDHMSMYGVNNSIPKTLVKYLIQYYAYEVKESNFELSKTLYDIIETPISPELLPTDGTTVTQKTEETVGDYELIDFFIYYFERKKFNEEKIVFLAKHAFKNKYTYDEIKKQWNNFIKRHSNNQFKRNCLPDGPKVGTVSVSPRGDKRMPADVDLSIWQLL